MPDDLDRAVDARIDGYRPDRVPSFSSLQDRRRRRDSVRGAAAVLGVLAVAGAAYMSSTRASGGVPAGQVAQVDSWAARPPESVTVGGVEFLRRGTERFVLHPGVRSDDELGVFVTVSQTYVPDGECAVHYEPVVASQGDEAVVLATWRYTPAQTRPTQSCVGVGHGDRAVRLQLQEPLGDRTLRIEGRDGPSHVLLLASDGRPVVAELTPANPNSAEICLEDRCVTVTDGQLLSMAADALNRALHVRPIDDCSDRGRTDNVDRTYLVRFVDDGRSGPAIEVPLGCSAIHPVGSDEEFALDSGGADVVRIAYDQQISPDNKCLGIGGPSGGPETKDYVGLTLEQAEQRAVATNNDGIRIAGRDGVCAGIVRDHVINRVNVYLVDGVVTAAHSF